MLGGFALGMVMFLTIWPPLSLDPLQVAALRGNNETLSSGQTAPSRFGKSRVRLLSVGLLEFQEETLPWRVVKVLLPMQLDVAAWWAEARNEVFTAKLIPCSEGEPHLHLQVVSELPLELPNGQKVDGISGIVHVPPNTVVEECELTFQNTVVDAPPWKGVKDLKALRISCPVSARTWALSPGGQKLTVSTVVLRALFVLILLLRVCPWPLMILGPFIWAAVRPGLSLLHVGLRKLLHWASRQRRVWRLWCLQRRSSFVDAAFGQDEPCCICYCETCQGEVPVALLPCRHTLHSACYQAWVLADSYPSLELMCPLCRRKVTGIGTVKAASD